MGTPVIRHIHVKIKPTYLHAQDRTLTSKGRLLHTVRLQRLSPVRACPHISLLHLYKQSSDNRVALEMEHAATLSPRLTL